MQKLTDFIDAPYGKGTKTVVDKNARSTKELDPKKITKGARICLIYNLKKGTSKVQPKAFKVSETAEQAARGSV